MVEEELKEEKQVKCRLLVLQTQVHDFTDFSRSTAVVRDEPDRAGTFWEPKWCFYALTAVREIEVAVMEQGEPGLSRARQDVILICS
jgi:hypothetical protein